MSKKLKNKIKNKDRKRTIFEYHKHSTIYQNRSQTFSCSDEIISKIDEARMDCISRSTYIKLAIVAKLKKDIPDLFLKTEI